MAKSEGGRIVEPLPFEYRKATGYACNPALPSARRDGSRSAIRAFTRPVPVSREVLSTCPPKSPGPL